MPLKNSKMDDGSASIKILNNVRNIPAFPLIWTDENAEYMKNIENADILKRKAVTTIN